MELQDFKKEFIETVKSLAAVEMDFEYSSFVAVAAQKLIEAEELTDFIPCYYEGTGRRNRKLRVDGYSFDDVDNTLNLLIADYRGGADLDTLTQTDAERSFDRLEAFIQEAVSGKLKYNIEESSPGFGLAFDIYEHLESIRRYRLFLITDTVLSSRVKDLPIGKFQGKEIEYHIWDMSRFHRVFESLTGREDLQVDFRNYIPEGIPCLEASQASSDEYKSFLCVIPGTTIADIYNKYGSRLLEGNVRSFLSVKGKVNKAIRSTILNEPRMFFAYNNGIAATATNVEVINSGYGLRITCADDLQIVNGGQTTASLAMAKLKDNIDLKNIFVQMKLSVVNTEKAQEIIPRISRCANSQNKVSEADFFSNHPFHVRMEEMSRRLFAPAVDGAQYETHWFYERARGQYINEQIKMTQAEKKRFLLQNPREQVITKTDLAKFHNAWGGLPHKVSLGAQKNFTVFAEWIAAKWEQSDTMFNEDFFKKSVVLAILFRHTERLVSRQVWYEKGYRANIVAYTIAKLKHLIDTKTKGKVLNTYNIWNRQKVSDALDQQLSLIAKDIFDIIISPDREVQNVTEWCKRENCWEKTKACETILIAAFKDELIDIVDEKERTKSARAIQRVDNGINAQIQVVNLGLEYWTKLLSWASEHNLLTSEDKRLLNITARIAAGMLPTDKQSKKLLEIKERMQIEGFSA